MKSIIALALAALAASSPIAQNQEEARAVDPLVNGYWSCTIPTTAVFTKVQSVFNTCGSGSKPQYWVVYPSDGLLSCRLPPVGSNYIFTQVRLVFGTCDLTGNANQYTLRTPKNAAESCSQPPPQSRLAVAGVRPVRGVCNTINTDAPYYRLATPAAGGEYCFYPKDAWTYYAVRNVRTCNIINTDAPLYKVVKIAPGAPSCEIPPGWSFSARSDVTTCDVRGVRKPLYTLKR